MKINVKKMNAPKIFLIINDIIILILNISLSVFMFIISYKEKLYRNSRKLFIFQLILSFIILGLDMILNLANKIRNYKGHNKYGMLLRFFMFYLIIPCIILTYQRSNNLNHDDILSSSNIAFYIGSINDVFILISMILSFVIIEKKSEETISVKKRKTINMNSIENIELLEESNEHSQIFTELDKKED